MLESLKLKIYVDVDIEISNFYFQKPETKYSGDSNKEDEMLKKFI